ncbi:MAG: CRISPR-associated helicase Cas3' [Desulfobacterales bacterium]|nr:CRISPR-associated helicase Cas3' [Desulfobacterales bacterium]
MIPFWAKTTKTGEPGISVFDHMVNVGCVAQCVAELAPDLLKRFHMTSSLVGAISALHDLGKISPGFQQKCHAWLEAHGLTALARNNVWDTSMETDHGKVTHAATQAFLQTNGIERKTAKFVSAVLGAHHGRLNPPNDRGYQPNKLITEERSGIGWDSERMAHASRVWQYFLERHQAFSLSESPALWWLAGLTSIADWIGSDERFFSPDASETHIDPKAVAVRALEMIGLGRVHLIENLTFHDLFHDPENPRKEWVPNDIQKKACAMIHSPGVYIIEAPMGTGKTEAALWAAYNLLVAGKAAGIYFALPTQATSNRMHMRMNDFLHRICSQNAASRLIHSNSWLMDKDFGIQPAITGKDANDATTGRDWFASSKRALIAPFGVGTVDQALLGVVAAKHFFVRHFALAGKVVILDEIHSYDLYTVTLIDKLITILEGLGCTVIILTATLTSKRRGQIIDCSSDGKNETSNEYPLLTGLSEGRKLTPVAPAPPAPRAIKIKFALQQDAADEAIRFARKGAAVLWICNTVEAAQIQYQRFKSIIGNEFPIGLLHSRFPFWRREQLENEWMERFGKNGKTRCPSIFVATQVVEQSVDLDADLLITELAPTDMLLQRIGRLWRHERSCRPVDHARICILSEEQEFEKLRDMTPKNIIKTLGSKALIYAPYILLRSLEIWSQKSSGQGEIVIPTQIRELIESTYAERDDEPDAWTKLHDDWFATDSAKKMIAARNCNLWQVALEDEEGVQTRLNEVPTIALILCREFSNSEASFLDDTKGVWGDDQHHLTTAQAIHNNLVKLPEYAFTHIDCFPFLSDYIRAKHGVATITENGATALKGVLKDGVKLFYSDELGLVIQKAKEGI